MNLRESHFKFHIFSGTGWDTIHTADAQGCDNCFSFSTEDLCTHVTTGKLCTHHHHPEIPRPAASLRFDSCRLSFTKVNIGLSMQIVFKKIFPLW